MAQVTTFLKDDVVSKDNFMDYVRVQMSGILNMWDSRVEQIANLTKEQHLYIIKNYQMLKDLYFTEEEFKKFTSELCC